MIFGLGNRRSGDEHSRARSRFERASRRPRAKVSLDEVSPEPAPFLGHAAYLQLALFEALTQCASNAPDLDAKADLSAAAGRVLEKHAALVAELEALALDPAAAMQPFRVPLDRYFRVIAGADWWESLLSAYLVSGLLDDFFARLASGLPTDGDRIADLLSSDGGRPTLVALLQVAVLEEPRLSSRLALWGRRLVGDTLLIARSALPGATGSRGDATIEPIVTDLIAAHTRRMDLLGLTA